MTIDTGNWQGVGVKGNNVIVMLPKTEMTSDAAITHAAWLVAMSAISLRPPQIEEVKKKFLTTLEAIFKT